MKTQELELLDQIIKIAEYYESELNKLRLTVHQANKTVGQGALTTHLNSLKELLSLPKNFSCPGCKTDLLIKVTN